MSDVWGCVQHVAFRELLHLSGSAGLTLGTLLIWSEVARTGILWRLRGISFWVFPPLLGVFFFIALKEPFDVHSAGINACQEVPGEDPPWKSVVDIIFWNAGSVLTSAGIYRGADRFYDARRTTDLQLAEMKARRIREKP